MTATESNMISDPALTAWFTNTSDSVLLVGPDGTILQANHGAAAWLGHSPQHLAGENIYNLLQVEAPNLSVDLVLKACLREQPGSIPLTITFVPIPPDELRYLAFLRPSTINPEGARLARDKELLEVTLASISDGVLATDNDSQVIFINQVAASLLGYEPEQAIGRQLFDLFNRLEMSDASHPLENLLGDRVSIEFADNIITINRNDQEKILANSAATINDRQGNNAGLVMVFRDITEKVVAERQLAHLRFHDKLTGVYNRDYVDNVLQEWDDEAKLPLTLVLGDVNGLKLTNDVFGHLEGDRLLIQVAEIMQQASRLQDVVARWGGDEFVILMPSTAAEEGHAVCERIIQLCEQAMADPIKVSIALGVATRETPEVSIDDVFKDAEDLMYQVKLVDSQVSRQTMVESIKRNLWSRSQETEDHCSRVGYLLQQMAGVVWLDKRDKQLLSSLSQLHDIGKICVPAELLSRSGPLTIEEWEIIRRHPEQGHRIAQVIREMAPVAEAIMAHHERWDGTGYPRGLNGNDIPILARMLAIADAYDVMVHDRPYKGAIPRIQALEEIKNGAGTQFDPALARIFYEMFSRAEINRH
ncbi:MAG: HD domain-containing phosphohydrolase [Methanomassiliicoccales archaeon]